MKIIRLLLLAIVICASTMTLAQKRYVLSIACQANGGGLSFIDSDARLMANALGGDGADVELLSSESSTSPFPTRRRILQSVERIITSAKPTDSVWIYVSAHGNQKDGDGKSYIVTPISKEAYTTELLSISDLRSDLKARCKAKLSILILDACHSGSYKSRPIGKPEAPFGSRSGIVTIASCEVSQTSIEIPSIRHGVFTFFFVKGLAGAAKTSSGEVTMESLQDYVQKSVHETVSARGHKQTPVFMIPKEEAVAVLPTVPAETVASLPALPTENPVLQLSNPIPAGMVITVTGDGPEKEQEYAESLLSEAFTRRRYPVVASQLSRPLENRLSDKNRKAAGQQADRLHARFLVRVKIKSDVKREQIGSETSFSGETLLSIEIIDADGIVIASDSGALSDGRGSRGTGFSESSAIKMAIKRAVDRAVERVIPLLEDNRTPIPDRAG